MKPPIDPDAGWKDAEARSDLTLELPGDGGPMFFCRVPAGQFRMGERGRLSWPEPRHLVRMPHPFWMAAFPVTQRQFRAFKAASQIDHENHFTGSDLLPAEHMTWSQAMEFCEWLGDLVLPLHGRRASLPTEAEWEYACRAGTTTEFSSGDGAAALRQVGWFNGNSGDRTHQVGELGPSARNAWGLYDMHGNVWEWCLDPFDPAAYQQRFEGDDQFPKEGMNLIDAQANRVVRGGSWFIDASSCSSACRNGFTPDRGHRFVGFRVCLRFDTVDSDGSPKGRRVEVIDPRLSARTP